MKFIKDPMNIIDLSAIVPYYLSLLLEGLEVTFKQVRKYLVVPMGII